MSKTIFNILLISLLLIFVAGCGGGGGDSVSPSSSTAPNIVSSDTGTNPSDTGTNPGDTGTNPGDTGTNPGDTGTNPGDTGTNPTDQNLAPIAIAGDDMTVPVGSQADLSGAGSYDTDEIGNYPLKYTWVITEKPDGSNAISPDPDTLDPTFSFTVDKAGEYMIQLVVTDSLGMESDPAYVVVSTFNSRPVAYASSEPQVLTEPGTLVQLNGSNSYDPDGDPLTYYEWSITVKPADSNAVLSDETAVNPTFVADVVGTYVIELTVADNQGLYSDPYEVVVSSKNIKPVAVAGGNDFATIGEYYQLDGSRSHDANGDPLTYSWNITSKPKDSLTELIIDPNTPEYPTFMPDVEGWYTISLVVNDGSLDSDPSNISFYALNAEDMDEFIMELKLAVWALNNELDDSDFSNPNNRNALTLKILVVVKNYREDGYSESMLDKLTGDIAGKMDGCAVDPNAPAPDQNDWIINCTAQEAVYSHIAKAIEIFEGLPH